jgi:hypothetical protein
MGQHLSFFADVVVTGQVLGVDASCTPEEVTRVLGQYAENRQRNRMWRDYGVIEFFWDRVSATEPWQGTHLSLQVHRLRGDPTQMNEAVRRAYGDFAARLPFHELRVATSEAGSRLIEVRDRPPDEVREYANPERAVTVLVATTAGNLGLDEGEVWTVNCGNRVRGSGYAGPSPT